MNIHLYFLYQTLESVASIKDIRMGKKKFKDLGDEPAERELNALALADAGLWWEANGNFPWSHF